MLASRRSLAAHILLVACPVVAALLMGLAAPTAQGSPAPDPVSTESDDAPEGRWRLAEPLSESASSYADEELPEEMLREMERLRSIGYLTGSRAAPAATGLISHDRSRAGRGLNLYTSGHFPGAVLMDMEGNVLHLWERSFLEIWPDRWEESLSENADYWRHVHLFENGDVLAIFEGLGLVKLDKDSSIIWSHFGGEHHDLKVDRNGFIYVLTREPVIFPRINPDDPILEDSITVLSPEGRPVRNVSVVRAMGNSRYLHLLEGMSSKGDIFHTNAVEILDGSLVHAAPGLAAGNVLLSLRTLSLLIAVDLHTELATWALEGGWVKQHDPSVLENGNILLFDNHGNTNGTSRVIEIDPASGDIEWVFAGDPPEAFYSKMCGTAVRLPNGNTLATESDAGRAIEIASDGDIVWEYANPERAGEEGQLVATLFEMIRLPEDFPLGWLYGE